MESKILEFLRECQLKLGNLQNITSMEEVARQLINVSYFLLEKLDEVTEEYSKTIQSLQSELQSIQTLYNEGQQEIEELQKKYGKQIEECSQLEDKLLQKQYEVVQEKNIEIIEVREKNKEMVKSIRLQQQYIDSVLIKNQCQQREIQDLVIQLETLQNENKEQQQDDNSPVHHLSVLQLDQASRDQTPKQGIDYKQDINDSNSNFKDKSVFKFKHSENSCSSLQIVNEDQQLKFMKNPFYQNAHSKHQSINWQQLATITQTLRSIEYSKPTSQKDIIKTTLNDEISNTIHVNNIVTKENPYFDFFILISQSVKLDLNKHDYYQVPVYNLFEQLINQNIPFNKWYHQIKQYLEKQEYCRNL